MPIIEVNHVTKEFKLGQLTSLKQTALDDTTGSGLSPECFCRNGFSRENRELCLTPLTKYFKNVDYHD